MYVYIYIYSCMLFKLPFHQYVYPIQLTLDVLQVSLRSFSNTRSKTPRNFA